MRSSGWQAGLIAFLFVLIATPVVLSICRRWSLYDGSGPLKIHRGSIPRLGGAGIAVGLLIADASAGRSTTHNLAAWCMALGVIWLSGFVDDVRGLSAFPRLAAQVASGIALWTGGWRLPAGIPDLVGIAAVCAVVVLFVNAFNFLDGSDGLAGGVAAIIAATYIIAFSPTSMSLGTIVAWGLLGVCAAFLAFNFPPAKIFMGDSGSTVLGFCVAFLAIDFISRAPAGIGPSRWIFPAIVAAVPLADGIVVVLRRLGRGRSPFEGDRSHYYDLLLARGWTSTAVAFGTYAATTLLSVVGLSIIGCSAKAGGMFLVLCAIGIFLAAFVRRTTVTNRQSRSSRVARI